MLEEENATKSIEKRLLLQNDHDMEAVKNVVDKAILVRVVQIFAISRDAIHF